MIDLNEETYAIREEVTRLLQAKSTSSSMPLFEHDIVNQYEKRRKEFVLRVNEIEGNKSVKDAMLKAESERKSSPPQKDSYVEEDYYMPIR